MQTILRERLLNKEDNKVGICYFLRPIQACGPRGWGKAGLDSVRMRRLHTGPSFQEFLANMGTLQMTGTTAVLENV